MEQLVTSSRERTGPRPSGVTCCPTRWLASWRTQRTLRPPSSR